MNVLIDEDLPHKLRPAITGHRVSTVAYLGWDGLKNGALLKAAEAACIQVFVTGDKSLPFQQTLAGRSFGTVVLSSPDWPIIRDNLVAIQAAVDAANPGSVHFVQCVGPAG